MVSFLCLEKSDIEMGIFNAILRYFASYLHILNADITNTPLYEGNIQSKLKISFQARKSRFVKLSKNGSS